MLNPKEADEREYLGEVQTKLGLALDQIQQKIDHYSKEILETKRYIHENLAELDSAEKAANRTAVYESVSFGEDAVREREKLHKLIQSPYFGRIDFEKTQETEQKVFYIGVHSFVDPLSSRNIIFDWRAPISSMFYDFETGSAFYIAPIGKIEGTLHLKRQYRIRNSEMEYMLESSLNIGDDILQKELSRTSDDKMKNIVATIQREQNEIIRNEAAKVLIIQGAAGSGKTSIALHRVAFLLYRYKKILNSRNILILSPNKVFSNYISNVLPELGEENISEASFEEIAATLLGKKYHCQTFAQQVEDLLNDSNAEKIHRIQYKATNSFVEQLQDYLKYADSHFFVPTDLVIENFSVSKGTLLLHYHRLKKMPIQKRLRKIADDLISAYKRNTIKKMEPTMARQIRSGVAKMFQFSNPLLLYQDFYRHIGREDLFCLAGKNTFEFCDVYPFLYVKLYLEGTEEDYKDIQHLLVDEMQDYTPIQYAVLSKLFSCKMTILGDSYQSVNPYSSSSTEKIEPYFEGCHCVELCKSYRSTIEISQFAQKILENKKIIPIERHGTMPTITECQTTHEETELIQNLIEQFRKSEHTSLGIICKSQEQTNQLWGQLHSANPDLNRLDFTSNEFQEGIIITSVHMSKGLEFDQVIVPGVSDDFYQTQLDRSLLYIACTRAMHQLDLTCCGKKTEFLRDC
ncbi:HelD family protein [Clostridium minihomine]|uniref:HelD family protein n=1 Tax=Clostridium minihomine TaxID=2045012 RepID=UPI000C77CD9C|nr:UvrD-helicase domain-containing protein [Clostridium minihomine]